MGKCQMGKCQMGKMTNGKNVKWDFPIINYN